MLAGDNAIVIALAARALPPPLQRKAVIYGTALAVGLRVALTIVVLTLLKIPFVKLVGGALLLWIGYKLAVEEEDDPDIKAAENLRTAVITILMADVVMSLDNVLAVAARAHGSYLLIMLGLLISIPIVMGGANLILRLLHRFPAIVWLGAGLIAFTGVELMGSDPTIHDSSWYQAIDQASHLWLRLLELALAGVVLGVAWLRVRSRENAQAEARAAAASDAAGDQG